MVVALAAGSHTPKWQVRISQVDQNVVDDGAPGRRVLYESFGKSFGSAKNVHGKGFGPGPQVGNDLLNVIVSRHRHNGPKDLLLHEDMAKLYAGNDGGGKIPFFFPHKPPGPDL